MSDDDYSDYDEDQYYDEQYVYEQESQDALHDQILFDDSVSLGSDQYVLVDIPGVDQLDEQYTHVKIELSPEEKIREKLYELDWIEAVPSKYFPEQLKTFIKENLVCQICLKFMDQVVELECQHLCCGTCMKTLNKEKYIVQIKCPFCKHNIKSNEINNSLRSRLLQFYSENLPVPCFMCYDEKKYITQGLEEQKETQVENIWTGSFKDLEIHCQYHVENEAFVQQEIEDQFVSERCCNVGCQKTFRNNFLTSIHEGTDCQYRWIRCNQCLKIYFKEDYEQHKCKPDDFYENKEHLPKYELNTKRKSQSKNYQLTLVYLDNLLQQHLTILQIRKFFEFQTDFFLKNQMKVQSTFMRLNMMEALNSTKLKLKVIETEDTTSHRQDEDQTITIPYLSNYCNRQVTQNFQQLSSSQFYGISFEDYQTTSLFATRNNSQVQVVATNNHPQSQYLHEYGYDYEGYRKTSVFVALIVARSKPEASQIVNKIFSSFGEIQSFKNFGAGLSGKYFGLLEFTDVETARQVLIIAHANNGTVTIGRLRCKASPNKK